MAPKSETIPLRTEVAYEPRGLRTKGPSPNGGLGNWHLTWNGGLENWDFNWNGLVNEKDMLWNVWQWKRYALERLARREKGVLRAAHTYTANIRECPPPGSLGLTKFQVGFFFFVACRVFFTVRKWYSTFSIQIMDFYSGELATSRKFHNIKDWLVNLKLCRQKIAISIWASITKEMQMRYCNTSD